MAVNNLSTLLFGPKSLPYNKTAPSLCEWYRLGWVWATGLGQHVQLCTGPVFCVMSECQRLCSPSHLVFKYVVYIFTINEYTRNPTPGSNYKSTNCIMCLSTWLLFGHWKWEQVLPSSSGWGMYPSSLSSFDISSLLSANGSGSDGAITCFSHSESVQTFLDVPFWESSFSFLFSSWI